jgi:serine/threonine protein kinase
MDLSNDEKKRNQSYNEVRVVRARRHPNVTELIGSFVSGLEISGLPDDHPEEYHAQILYMLYPLAEMDMKRWLETRYPKLFPNDKGLERHIYSDAMIGLMSGVSWLHKEIDYEVAFHRDLKPENVLLFKSKTLVWKIADFGCANLKSLKDTTTKDWRGSPYWAPPEFMVDKGKEKSGRSHDIYSLGCMFIMLVTIIVHGWTDEGLPEFERRRVQHCKQNASQTISNEVGAFHNSEAVVLDWVEELKREAECDEKLEAVIRVIKEMLLSSEERISAWESVVYLYEATGEWESDVTDQTLKGLKAEKHDKVLEKLKSTIQDSRGVVDANKPRGPVKRAKEWKRSDGFLAILRDKEWFESIPKTTEELKERQSVTESPISTLPEDLSNKEPIFGYQKTFEDMTEAFSSCNIVVLCGLGGIG